ncbi:MAG: PTS lactose/cellobiose transporter subunit IIA [Eubacteriaceae bacterium]|nr:PTS lactose/cellobiose transporter subunit IIA [Eubacteriaceae bacterium]
MTEMELKIMDLIIYSGDAKTKAYEALYRANEGDYVGADKKIQDAHEAHVIAHNTQTSLLQKEAAGEKIEISALFVHAQDHLMTSMSEINMIEQIIELRKVVNTLMDEVKTLKGGK